MPVKNGLGDRGRSTVQADTITMFITSHGTLQQPHHTDCIRLTSLTTNHLRSTVHCGRHIAADLHAVIRPDVVRGD